MTRMIESKRWQALAMDAQGIAFRTQNRLLALLAPMHREIVTRA